MSVRIGGSDAAAWGPHTPQEPQVQSRVRNRISSCRGVRHASLRVRSPQCQWQCAMPMELDRARTHFLKLIHVAKIGTKPCELESHRLRMDSSHMQPCFSGSLPGCAGRAPAHAPHARSLNVQLSPTLSYAQPPVRNASHASWLTCRSPCVQLIHDAHVHHRMRSSCGTVVTVLRRHTKRSSSCLPRCLRLNC